MNINNGWWRGLITGMMLGAGAAVLLTLKQDAETSGLDDGAMEIFHESNEAGDALSGTLDLAQEAANDVKDETHDVVESV